MNSPYETPACKEIFWAEICTCNPRLQTPEQVATSLDGIKELLLKGVTEGFIRDHTGVSVGTFKFMRH